MEKCKECGLPSPEVLQVKKICYLCILKKWPPKTRSQEKQYINAVSIRLRLVTPIDNLDDSLHIVKKIGLENLQKIQEIIDGKVITLQPRNTFYQRLMEELENDKRDN